MNKLIVSSEYENSRLDVYVSSVTDLSRSKVAKMIKEEYILLDEEPAKANSKVFEGDEVIVMVMPVELQPLEPVQMDLDIIYEDNDVIVINKPKGLVVHPGAGTSEPTLVSGLLYHTNQLSQSEDPVRPGIVHRLDKDTSGLLVVAKNDQAHQHLAGQLAKRTMKRTYVTLVHGRFEHLKAKIDAPIGRDEKNRQKMTVTEKNSKHAITHVTLLETFKEMSYLKCQLETGRTHQIRVHLQFIGYPVVGDPVYSYKKTDETSGQLLHAYEIEFVHPTTQQTMSFTCDVPPVFEAKLKECRETNG